MAKWDLKRTERGRIGKTEMTGKLRENTGNFPEDVVQEELREKVGIDSILTHELMMFDMILLF